MTVRTFIDTNILVYARDTAHPDKQRIAHTLLGELWRDRTGRLNVQVCNEYFASAYFAECTRIVSEDLGADQDYFGIRVVNPFSEGYP